MKHDAKLALCGPSYGGYIKLLRRSSYLTHPISLITNQFSLLYCIGQNSKIIIKE